MSRVIALRAPTTAPMPIFVPGQRMTPPPT
jgi:hypothetical protein